VGTVGTRHAFFVLLVACGGQQAQPRPTPTPTPTPSAAAAVATAPRSAGLRVGGGPSIADASAPCTDPTWWLAYLVTLAQTRDARKLAFVARQTSRWSDEVDQAQDALAKAAAGRDAGKRARAIADAEATIAKDRPACAPPFSLVTPKQPVRTDAGVVLGWLDPRVIQHVVRANFGRAKLCYEDALRKDSWAHGRIETKFVIAVDGTVSSAADVSKPGETIHDAACRECIRRMFTTLTFPPPEGGGVVTVVYPLIFTPGAD
jgi:hypothetical protein